MYAIKLIFEQNLAQNNLEQVNEQVFCLILFHCWKISVVPAKQTGKDQEYASSKIFLKK